MNGAARNVLRHIALALTRKPGSRRTNEKPSLIDAQIFCNRAFGSGAGSTNVNSTATTARKLTALMASAHANPPNLITMPASVGPTTRPRLNCADDNAIAPERSSTGTRSGSRAWNAGKPSAAQMPLPNAISATAGAPGLPVAKRIVRTVARPSCTIVVLISSHFRGRRSASAPPRGPKNAIGTNAAAATMPTHSA